jgi:hypothetical protein
MADCNPVKSGGSPSIKMVPSGGPPSIKTFFADDPEPVKPCIRISPGNHPP